MATNKSKAIQKQERLEHANALLRIIGSYGRRFFWYGGSNVYDEKTGKATFVPADRYAKFELRRGYLYFIDEYSQKAIYLHKTGFRNNWRGFNQGGTMRSLVESIRDYITEGTPVPRWKIVIKQLGHTDLVDNIWGYKVEDATKVRELAYALPILALAGE